MQTQTERERETKITTQRDRDRERGDETETDRHRENRFSYMIIFVTPEQLQGWWGEAKLVTPQTNTK